MLKKGGKKEIEPRQQEHYDLGNCQHVEIPKVLKLR